ncbi:MAG: TIGR01212 family radical SAM protein [Candidatus Fibromonas sp.]|jgi:radical SAM protein (TIGR01212 family)|nr:TIGR01212 family radical SAM protein [Candidatus Fibromonas sp.]
MIKPYRDFLKEVFPLHERVRKVSLNAGFGCPSFCAYCNNSSFSSVAKTELPLLEQLEAGIKSIRKRKRDTGILAYFQSYTNTYAPVQKLREVFTPVILHGEVAGISIGTRPDCLHPQVVELLAELNEIKPVIVEIGVQTANDRTLKNINRNHTAECSRSAALLCKNSGLLTTAHIIIGLPDESSSDFANTAKLVRDCGFSSIKIHPLHIVKGTAFAEREIKLLSLEEYCKAVAEVIRIVSPDMAIERISGESPSDMLIAPAWSGNRTAIWLLVQQFLRDEQVEQDVRAEQDE